MEGRPERKQAIGSFVIANNFMAKSYDYILMDLDGTITDPGLGITRCVRYALEHFGIKVGDLQELYGFIGPPLSDSFREFYGFTEEQTGEAIEKYRERFARTGMYENTVYPGMESMLEHLQAAGKKLLVATSKPEVFARQILEHFQLAGYFEFIGGATLDGARSRKEEVIRYVLETYGVRDLTRAVMVGDRKYDIIGGQLLGIDTIGVSYGYGSPEELKEAGANKVVASVEELESVLIL